MNNYTMYFEFFGKKMKTEVWAKSEEQAKNQIVDRINYLKIESRPVTEGEKSQARAVINNAIKEFQRFFNWNS